MAEDINYQSMTAKELAKHKEALLKAEQDLIQGAPLDVVAAVALKWAMGRLKERGKLGTAFDGINVQALPKESLMASPAGLSETQIETIKKNVASGLDKAGRLV